MNSLQTLCDGLPGGQDAGHSSLGRTLHAAGEAGLGDARSLVAVRASGRHPVGGEGVRRVWWRDYLPA